jgi:tetratricopeptide (TPR) repeat protein
MTMFTSWVIMLAAEPVHAYIEGVMKTVEQLLEQGKQMLFEKKAQQSMQFFNEALEICPVENTLRMGEIFFFLGLAFRNLGHKEYALRCWENAAFIRDRNDEINDKDWRVFHTIQTSRYLIRKGTGQFDTLAESDMVHDLIRMTWYEICDLDGLRQMSYYQRCEYYRSIHISFPVIGAKQIDNHHGKKGQIVPFIKSE